MSRSAIPCLHLWQHPCRAWAVASASHLQTPRPVGHSSQMIRVSAYLLFFFFLNQLIQSSASSTNTNNNNKKLPQEMNKKSGTTEQNEFGAAHGIRTYYECGSMDVGGATTCAEKARGARTPPTHLLHSEFFFFPSSSLSKLISFVREIILHAFNFYTSRIWRSPQMLVPLHRILLLPLLHEIRNFTTKALAGAQISIVNRNLYIPLHLQIYIFERKKSNHRLNESVSVKYIEKSMTPTRFYRNK
eukprot:gene11367-7873_t